MASYRLFNMFMLPGRYYQCNSVNITHECAIESGMLVNHICSSDLFMKKNIYILIFFLMFLGSSRLHSGAVVAVCKGSKVVCQNDQGEPRFENQDMLQFINTLYQ